MSFYHPIILVEFSIYVIAAPIWFRIWYRCCQRYLPAKFRKRAWLGVFGMTLFWPLVVPLSYAELIIRKSQEPII